MRVQSHHHLVGNHQGEEILEIHGEFHHRRNQKINHDENILKCELRKITPPSFNGEKYGEVAKIWPLEMNKYLHLHDYFDNQEVQIDIYNI